MAGLVTRRHRHTVLGTADRANVGVRGRVDAFRAAAPSGVARASGSRVLVPAGLRARSSRRCSRTRSPCRAPTPSACAIVLEEHFGDRPDGSFTRRLRARDSRDPAALGAPRSASVDRAAPAVPHGARPTQLSSPARRHVVLRRHRLDAQPRAGEGLHRRRPARRSAGRRASSTPTSRAPARSSTISTRSSTRTCSRASRDRAPDRAARPARRVRALVGGDDPAHLRRRARSPARSGSSTASRTWRSTPTYATNLVQLIGLGIAVDYSLLIVYRFREELAGTDASRRRRRAHDGDGRPRGRLLRRRGRARPRAAGRDAAAVHADDGRRRAS